MTTLVTFLLDRSGSMEACRESTIEAFNGYLTGLQAETEATIDFTFLQFDTQSLDKLCVATEVAKVPLLTRNTYQPRGGTPLVDACFKTIKAVEEAVVTDKSIDRIVICFQTDGYENASTEHTNEELQALIQQRTAEGWQFNFMGAGVDAYLQAAQIGIGAVQTMSYDQTDRGSTKSAFASAATNTRDYATMRTNTTNFSAQQRMAAGDKYAPADLIGRKIVTGPASSKSRNRYPISWI